MKTDTGVLDMVMGEPIYTKVEHSSMPHNRSLTVAAEVRVVPSQRNGLHTCHVTIGYAVKSPEDKFERKMGKRIALGRARKNPIMSIFMETTDDYVMVKELVNNMFTSVQRAIHSDFKTFIPLSAITKNILYLDPASGYSAKYAKDKQIQRGETQVQPDMLQSPDPASEGLRAWGNKVQ